MKIRYDNSGSQQKKVHRLQLLSSLDLLTSRQGGDLVVSTQTTAVVVGRRQTSKGPMSLERNRCRLDANVRELNVFTLAMVATHARRSRIGSRQTFNERSSPKGS